MKKVTVILSLVVMVFLFQSCAHRWHANPLFLEKTANHRIVAIIPFEMVFTGKQPKKLTPGQIMEIEEAESLAFQRSLYHLLCSEQARRRHPVRIDIQPISKTNQKLEAAGIPLRTSWELEPIELARILGVDAVVKTRVIKRRYMSGLASFGLELGATIVNVLSEEFPLGIFIPTATKKIMAHCFLFNGKDGFTLWSRSVEDFADWSLPANDIVDWITQHFAASFPYR